MRRWIDLLLSDWPLKLGAIGLALVLYGGVTLSDNDRSWPGDVPIEILDPPQGGAVLDLPGSVTNIRYRAPIEAAVALANGSFTASVDLGHVTPAAGAPAVTVPVRVTALDPRVQVVDFTPRSVSLRVDQVVTRPMTVTVDRGTVPPGLALGPPVVSPSTAILRGASSRVAAVQSVVARVAVDASGLNVEQDVDLEAIDDTGAPVPGIEILPQGVHVSIEVARELGYVTLPVVPTLTGQVASGYRLTSVTVQPTTLTVSGEVATVSALTSVTTEPIDITGLTGPTEVPAVPRLPEDVTAVGSANLLVTLVVEADVGSRTIAAGIRVDGARRNRVYTPSTPSVLVTLAGPLPALDTLDPATIVARIDVAGLGSGTHEVDVTVEAIEGLQVLGVAPASIRVQVAAAPTPSPVASSVPSVTVPATMPPSEVPSAPAGESPAPAEAPTPEPLSSLDAP
ncbi:MAG: hypothetical protein KF809_07795 [Chloroflexi bacterium]|nr:hypothetical protein [Chloroflexota bacterium]